MSNMINVLPGHLRPQRLRCGSNRTSRSGGASQFATRRKLASTALGRQPSASTRDVNSWGISMGNSNGQAHNRDNGNWRSSSRWHGITRPYTQSDVDRLKGSLPIEHSIAGHGAERLWSLLQDGSEAFVPALGAMTGNQAVQQVRAGLKAVYVSGWQ